LTGSAENAASQPARQYLCRTDAFLLHAISDGSNFQLAFRRCSKDYERESYWPPVSLARRLAILPKIEAYKTAIAPAGA
jgi:hypothetical protein